METKCSTSADPVDPEDLWQRCPRSAVDTSHWNDHLHCNTQWHENGEFKVFLKVLNINCAHSNVKQQQHEQASNQKIIKHPCPMQCDRLSVTARSSMCRCQHEDGDSAVLALQGFPHSRGPPAKSWHKTDWETKRQTSKCQVLLYTADMNSPRRFKASQPVSTRYRLPCQGQRTDTPSAKSSKSPPKCWSQAARTHKNMIYSLNLTSVGCKQ